MNIKDKIEWLQQECKELGLTLSLGGECGFGRPCVGVLFIKGKDSFFQYDVQSFASSNDPTVVPAVGYIPMFSAGIL